ncbi:SIMPL domain-containing protein [Methylocella sp.]|uniref:SIMPL domain-containing protein n=1 Tax=Methylocella sp. TaxID=1978226 RepID=UPI003784D8CA
MPPSARPRTPGPRSPAQPTRLTRAATLPLAAAIGLCAGQADAQEPAALPSITVVGEARAEVPPDVAVLSFAVSTEKKTAVDAAEANARATQAVIAEVRAEGVEPRDIRTLGVTLIPLYDDERDPAGRLVRRTARGYEARNEISVRLRQLDRVGALARRWIESGANRFDGVYFDVENKEAALDALRGEAMRDAERKADAYIKGFKVKLGRILSIAPRGAGPRPVAMAMARADKAGGAGTAIPIEPGVETLSVEVEARWELLPD